MITFTKLMIGHILLSSLLIELYSSPIIKRSPDNPEGLSQISSIAERLPMKLSAINSLANSGAQNGHISTLIKNINDHGSSDTNADDGKLGIPGPIPIDIEQIKKIAAIIGFIGNQLIPSLIDPNGGSTAHDYVENVK